MSRYNTSKKEVRETTYRLYNRFLNFLQDATWQQAVIGAVFTVAILMVMYGASDYLEEDHEYNLSDSIADFPDYNLSDREQVIELPVYNSSSYSSMTERCHDVNGTVATNKSSLDGVETVLCVLS